MANGRVRKVVLRRSAQDLQTPVGGVRAGARTMLEWSWVGPDGLQSSPLRCRRNMWYLAQARLTANQRPAALSLAVRFSGHGRSARRWLQLVTCPGRPSEVLGWLQAPAWATHLEASLPAVAPRAAWAELVLHPVAERDPKCHPLANLPRWSSYAPAFPLRRLVLPAALAGLRPILAGVRCDVITAPRSLAELRHVARGAACIVDPRWVATLNLAFADLERLAHEACLIVDLETATRTLRVSHVPDAEVVTHAAPLEIMSARVEYADFPTRGFAQQDVVPFATVARDGRFTTRVLRATRPWRAYADDAGFATLLASETPWAGRHGDVLSAACPVGRGELIITDLPWLVAGQFGPLIAPRIATHLLRMHVGLPAADDLQYWNRWDDTTTVVRDLADFAQRYAPLRAVRWASTRSGLAHLGVTLPATTAPRRHILLQTGRIDQTGPHDGLPPEPVTILMKWLAREARDQTPWAQQHLARCAVTWQFDTADGLKYVVNFDAAERVAAVPAEIARLRVGQPTHPSPRDQLTLPLDEGIFGDGSLAFQDLLTRRVCRLIERA